jgi:regulator of sigma D
MPAKKPAAPAEPDITTEDDGEDVELQAEIEQIQDAAKARFSLEDRLNDQHYESTKPRTPSVR